MGIMKHSILAVLCNVCVPAYSWIADMGTFALALVPTAQNQHISLPSHKRTFIDSLDTPTSFNKASKARTKLLNEIIPYNPTPSPGSEAAFQDIAPGTWAIVYAPHISTLSGLVGGKFDPVLYKMNSDNTIISHARYTVPVLGSGWLSVSGTYGSVSETTSRVDFDRAWIRTNIFTGLPQADSTERGTATSATTEAGPYESYDQVPDGLVKSSISTLGNFGFRKEFSIFPVSYLDDDTVVFDFELFGTRICARKIAPPSTTPNAITATTAATGASIAGAGVQ